jgi:hypothetical protein
MAGPRPPFHSSRQPHFAAAGGFGLLLRPTIRGHLAPASGRQLTPSPGPRDEAPHSSGRRRLGFCQSPTYTERNPCLARSLEIHHQNVKGTNVLSVFSSVMENPGRHRSNLALLFRHDNPKTEDFLGASMVVRLRQRATQGQEREGGRQIRNSKFEIRNFPFGGRRIRNPNGNYRFLIFSFEFPPTPRRNGRDCRELRIEN